MNNLKTYDDVIFESARLNEEGVKFSDSLFGTLGRGGLSVGKGIFNMGKFFVGKIGEQLKKNMLKGLALKRESVFKTAIDQSKTSEDEYQDDSNGQEEEDSNTPDSSVDTKRNDNTSKEEPSKDDKPEKAPSLIELFDTAIDNCLEILKIQSPTDKNLNKLINRAAASLYKYTTEYERVKGKKPQNVYLTDLMNKVNSSSFVNLPQGEFKIKMGGLGHTINQVIQMGDVINEKVDSDNLMNIINLQELKAIEYDAELIYTIYKNGAATVNQKLKTYWLKVKAQIDSKYDTLIDGNAVDSKLNSIRRDAKGGSGIKAELKSIDILEKRFGVNELLDSLKNVRANDVVVMTVKDNKESAYMICRVLGDTQKIKDENFYWFVIYGVKGIRGDNMYNSSLLGKKATAVLADKKYILAAFDKRTNSNTDVFLYDETGKMLLDKPMSADDYIKTVDFKKAAEFDVLSDKIKNSSEDNNFKNLTITKKGIVARSMVVDVVGKSPDAVSTGALNTAKTNFKKYYEAITK